MYKQMDIGALSLNKSRLAVTFCPEHEYFILSLSLTAESANTDPWPGYTEAAGYRQFVYK